MSLKGSIVIAFSGRRYLMVRHAQRAWEYPGGRSEGNETPLETAKREFVEETGLAGTGWKECGIAHLVTGDLALFTCKVSGRPKPQTDEISEARFLTALPVNLSFERQEYFQLMAMAGLGPKQKTDYDAASREFDSLRGKTASDEYWTDALTRSGHIRSGARILDIGCGTGRHSIALERAGAEVFGLDYSAGMLSRANTKTRGCWAQADAAGLPVGGEKFDLAMMILGLQHVDDESLAISEARRALKPGGRILIATVSNARIRRNITGLFPGLAKLDLDRFMPVPELKWHLRNCGFTEISQYVMRTPKKTETVDALVERFRRRYISTLALVPEKDFERNLAIFEARLRKICGNSAETDVEITFLSAVKML
ncbi:MAG: methyltransferase domain-containing protein [Thermoplasmata archaeon]|nr:methyltransferase domain-containing protein [Thermoplasmata archaeon]